MPTPKTKGGTPKLSDLARHVVVPSGVAATGWPAVRDTCAGFGVGFDSWQDGAGRLILAKRADGSYAASIGGVVMSIPRQVGKTYLIGAIVFALCLLNPGLTVLWTAHRLRTANETFSKMQSFARRRKVKPHVAKVVLGSGDEEIQFHNGSRILFGARERGFGRGFDDVDIEVFDEAQILTENATDDMIPAMNTAANPLPIYIGTPPKDSDPSEVFTLKRSEALSGDDEDTAYIEFSADQDADPEDRSQWARANPSYPGRTPESAMLRMKKNLTPVSFLREGLGIWADDSDADPWGVIPKASYRARITEAPSPDAPGWLEGQVALSVEMDQALTYTAICVAGDRPDGIGAAVVAIGTTSEWVLETLIAMCKPAAEGVPSPVSHVVIDGHSPAGSLTPTLQAAGITVTEPKTEDVKRAAGTLVALSKEGGIEYRESPELTRAMAVGVLRKHGEGRLIDRNCSAHVFPLIGLNLAVWGHQNQPAAATSSDFLVF